MSALAEIERSRGNFVTGSDLRLNNLTEELFKKGAGIFQNHAFGNITEDIDIVIKSACIRDDNPEIQAAKMFGIPIITRSQMLKRTLDEADFSIGVTGTHGKTTTSSLIAHILEYCGKDPTVIVGGEVPIFFGNAKIGQSGIFVAEVDESDGYFSNVNVTCAVITNIEREHMENYGSMKNLKTAYKKFIENVPSKGFFVFNGHDPVIRSIIDKNRPKGISFGIDGDFNVTGRNYSYSDSIKFDLIINGKKIGKISNGLVGRYNLMNILAALSVCMKQGVDFDMAAQAVSRFTGVKRRFELAEKIDNIRIIEDYAHHPTELRSVITAAKDCYKKGALITIFQPHRYSRTLDLLSEFSGCFYGSDVFILTDIYSADEDKIEGIDINKLYDIIDKKRFERTELLAKKDIASFVSRIAKDNDTILLLGAGDIREIARDIAAALQRARLNIC